MVNNHLIEHISIFHSATHKVCTLHIPSIIRECYSACFSHATHAGKLFPFQSFGNRTDNVYLDYPGFFHPFLNGSQYGSGINYRAGIGHSGYTGYPASGSGLGPCVNIFFSCLSRFAEMYVHINQPRSDKTSGGIIHFSSLLIRMAAQGNNLPVFDYHIPLFMLSSCRIYDGSVFNYELQCLFPP